MHVEQKGAGRLLFFCENKALSFIMSVPFVGIWKPYAAPMPYRIQMHNSAANYLICPCRTKGEPADYCSFGKACLNSWLNSYHGLCKLPSWLLYNRWLDHSLLNKFPPLGSIMGSKNHAQSNFMAMYVSHNHHY